MVNGMMVLIVDQLQDGLQGPPSLPPLLKLLPWEGCGVGGARGGPWW